MGPAIPRPRSGNEQTGCLFLRACHFTCFESAAQKITIVFGHDEEWDFTILKSGPLGGDQQMGSRIVDGQIDYLFFFTDPMTLQPHDTDVKALTRLAGVENIVFCCNRSTADHIISSPLFMDPDYERIHPDYSSYTKRFQDKPVVTEAVESVNRRKKKRK